MDNGRTRWAIGGRVTPIQAVKHPVQVVPADEDVRLGQPRSRRRLPCGVHSLHGGELVSGQDQWLAMGHRDWLSLSCPDGLTSTSKILSPALSLRTAGHWDTASIVASPRNSMPVTSSSQSASTGSMNCRPLWFWAA